MMYMYFLSPALTICNLYRMPRLNKNLYLYNAKRIHSLWVEIIHSMFILYQYCLDSMVIEKYFFNLAQL